MQEILTSEYHEGDCQSTFLVSKDLYHDSIIVSKSLNYIDYNWKDQLSDAFKRAVNSGQIQKPQYKPEFITIKFTPTFKILSNSDNYYDKTDFQLYTGKPRIQNDFEKVNGENVIYAVNFLNPFTY